MNREVHVACNCFIETEELLKAIGSHIYCNSGNIWKQCKTETLLLQITNRFRSPSSYMVSAEPFPGRSRPMSCKLAQMGPHQSPGCDYNQRQTMNHIVDTCPLTEFEDGLNRLHNADDDTVMWLESAATAQWSNELTKWLLQ